MTFGQAGVQGSGCYAALGQRDAAMARVVGRPYDQWDLKIKKAAASRDRYKKKWM
jgi:hypothetical protein